MKSTKWSCLLLAALLLTVNACSTKQDPLDGQPDNIKNGVPPDKKTDKPSFDARNVVIDSDDAYVMKENESQTITFTGRYLLPDAQDIQLILKNQAEFPGIKVTSVNGSHTNKGLKPAQLTITWTPKASGTDNIQKFFFDVVMYIPNLNIVAPKSVPLFVEKKIGAPQIVRDEKMPTSIREGEQVMATIYVNDITGEDADGKRPVLTLVSEAMGVPQLNQFVSVGRARSVGANLWAFDVRFDLKAEITPSQYQTSLKFVASNRYGQVSQEKLYTIKVTTAVEKPQTSWANKSIVNFKAGQKNTYNFWIMDPKFEGNITWIVAASSDLNKWPGKATLTCQYVVAPNGSSNSQAFCQLDWDIPAGTTDTSKLLTMTLQNASKVTGDTTVVKEVFERTITITP